MKAHAMTPAQLLEHLDSLAADAPLVFATPEAEIRNGYHLTEVKRSETISVDCGGRISNWRDARLQLLDGYGGRHMSVGKFSAILRRCIDVLPDLRDLPLHAEFAPGNAGLQVFDLSEPGEWDGRVVIGLRPRGAECKPFSQSVLGKVSGLAQRDVSGQMPVRLQSAARSAIAGCCGRSA